jgi:hypothetical protein
MEIDKFGAIAGLRTVGAVGMLLDLPEHTVDKPRVLFLGPGDARWSIEAADDLLGHDLLGWASRKFRRQRA